jgi:hypothetical protein
MTLDRYVGRLARALAHVINIFDPDAIVLGGGLSAIASLYDSVPRRVGRIRVFRRRRYAVAAAAPRRFERGAGCCLVVATGRIVMSVLCRDCGSLGASSSDAGRCVACASPRVVAHPELGSLSIAHIDCDAFYATVEKRDRPELAEQPVIVGGRQRGVVLACCYVARLYGVRSAMPMFKALAACPHAVVIRPDMAKYREVGRAVRAEMRQLTPLVEPLSIDEAFLDLSGTAAVKRHGAGAGAGRAGAAHRDESRRHRVDRAQLQQVSR